MAAFSSAERNFATGDSSASPSIFSHTSPPPPAALAWSVSRSSCARPIEASPGTRMPLTHGAWKARNPVPATASVSSTSSMPKRTSGLSEPNRSCASRHVIVRDGVVDLAARRLEWRRPPCGR